MLKLEKNFEIFNYILINNLFKISLNIRLLISRKYYQYYWNLD